MRQQSGELGAHYAHLLQQALPLLTLLLLVFVGKGLAGYCAVAASYMAACAHMDYAAVMVRLGWEHPLAAALWAAALAWAVVCYVRSRPRRVFMLDFCCFQPDDMYKCNYEVSEYFTRQRESFTLPSVEFQNKIFLRSGLGDECYIAPFTFGESLYPTYDQAREEASMVMCGSVEEVLRKCAVDPSEVDILVANCSLFSPAPSLAAMLVNRFKFREDLRVYNLSGMGCSASVIACKLAKDMLQSGSSQYALVVSTESISLNWYNGNVKSMLVSNCLFRCGCAAIVLTNKKSLRPRCRYELLHCVRTHKAADDKAYLCAHQTEDAMGNVAVTLNKDLMGVAADAMRANLIRLGPLILPLSEQAHFVFSLICRQLLKLQVKQYQPDFKLGVQHFCLHAGGRAVIDEIQKNLQLNDHLLEPSRATLHRFGNTSASCLWYVFSYMETKQRIKKGDIVWMLGLGSGFKCNSAIWKALQDIPMPVRSPWLSCIHRYPPPSWTRDLSKKPSLPPSSSA